MDECIICFIEYENQCVTCCNHKFCIDCLLKWFKKNKTSCPICRVDITEYKYMDDEYEVLRKIVL